MTCLEYLLEISRNGSFAIVPRGTVAQHSITSGNDGNTSNGMTVTLYRDETPEKAKRNDKIVEAVSMLVLNTPSDNASVKRFYTHCMNIVPAEFSNGEYDKDAWVEFLLAMALSVAAILTKLTIKERHWNGAATLLKILQCRIDAWNSKVLLNEDSEGKVTTVIFDRF